MANTTSLPNQAIKEVAISMPVDDEKLDQKTINDLLIAMDEIERGEGIPLEEVKEIYFKRYGIKF